MDNFQEKMNITLSHKTRAAMMTFLKKYGGDSQDVSHFIEEAITWRIMERQAAVREFMRNVEAEAAENRPDDSLMIA